MRDITPPLNWSRRADSDRHRQSVRRPEIQRSLQRTTTRTVSFDIVTPRQQTIHVEEITTIEEIPPTRDVDELSTERKVHVMMQALEVARADRNKELRRKVLFKRLALILVVAVLLLSTGYVGFDTLMTNSRLQAEATPTADSSTGWSKDEEGKDETKPAVNALDSYIVSPSLPRALYSSKLGIAAKVLPMGVNSDGSIQAPRNIFDAGWYSGSVKPGETGAMFIDGHASGQTREGLFAYLDTLVVGDTLEIEKGDGTKLNYEVVHVETTLLDHVDMAEALKPYGGAEKGLNLMTCTGAWIPAKKTYDHRVIVYTKQV